MCVKLLYRSCVVLDKRYKLIVYFNMDPLISYSINVFNFSSLSELFYDINNNDAIRVSL